LGNLVVFVEDVRGILVNDFLGLGIDGMMLATTLIV